MAVSVHIFLPGMHIFFLFVFFVDMRPYYACFFPNLSNSTQCLITAQHPRVCVHQRLFSHPAVLLSADVSTASQSLDKVSERGCDEKKPFTLIVQGLPADVSARAFCENDCSQTHPILILSLLWTWRRSLSSTGSFSPPLEFSRVIVPHLLPQLVCHELIPGGKTIPVTNENK